MSSVFEALVDLPIEVRNKLATYTDGLGTADIDDASVTTAKLAPAAVTTTELGALAVTTAKLAANAVTVAKLDPMIQGAAQSLSGAGAVNVTARTTKYTSTGASQALTLANGTVTGQRKTICHIVDGGSGILTPVSLAIGTTITFTAVRDMAELEWNGTAWDIIALVGATTA